ncbi:thioredoxin family protein [Ningiella sp. W23]|uniref:thioredoxin family protein n=1 Tax=Ningiella sp. W23 TaxID=3023715 RepID=UPI003756B3F2
MLSFFLPDSSSLSLKRANVGIFIVLALLFASLLRTPTVKAEQDTQASSNIHFIAHDNDEARVDLALKSAIEQGKLLLLVLGAQWCHDSRGFADKIEMPALAPVILEKYELLFVDLGNYNDKREITRRFGYPIFFGTPTVMIIDPSSEALLNLDSLQIFNNADSLPVEDYVSYFANFEAQDFDSEAMKVSKNALDQFEEEQAERLMKAYIRLRPLMEAEDEGRLEDKEAFYSLWGEVRDFRFALQKDIHALRMGELDTIPSYEAFSWEVK